MKNANTRFFCVRESVIGVFVGLGPAAVLWGRPTAAGVVAMANAPAMHPPNGHARWRGGVGWVSPHCAGSIRYNPGRARGRGGGGADRGPSLKGLSTICPMHPQSRGCFSPALPSTMPLAPLPGSKLWEGGGASPVQRGGTPIPGWVDVSPTPPFKKEAFGSGSGSES